MLPPERFRAGTVCARFWGGNTWEMHTRHLCGYRDTSSLGSVPGIKENGNLHNGLEIRGPSQAGMGAADFSGSFCIGILCTS